MPGAYSHNSADRRLDALEAQAHGLDAEIQEIDAEFDAALARLDYKEIGAFADTIAADLAGKEVDAGTWELAEVAWAKLTADLGAERIAALFAS